MNTVKTVIATLFVLAATALVGWAGVWGFGYLQAVLAPIDASTMALVVAGWIGVWGAALILVLGARIVFGRAQRMAQRKRRADVYAYLLDVWASASALGDPPSNASDSTHEAYANIRASHRQAERRLALHGSSSVINAYHDARESGGAYDEVVEDVLIQMRRDLGHSTFGTDSQRFVDLSVPISLTNGVKTDPQRMAGGRGNQQVPSV